ncbi:MAG: hypothetical protein NW200_01190 [Hyphomonadaceae bacterium]|nr:hypothetical protein [Hyphomonadaceae bacterium]
MWGVGAPRIDFICEERDKGVIAEPRPARAAMPDWYRRLAPLDHDAVSTANNGLTIKRCMPFVDALKLGWILPVCATVRLEISEGGARLDAGWDFDRPMVTFHNREQVAGHPRLPRPPAKLHNYWTVRTPKGWSCLFTPLLNRADGVIEIVSGVVDTDRYPAHIHFPFFATGADGRYTLEKGMPLVQVIPFRRDAVRAVVRAETESETDDRERALRAMQAGDGWYRAHARARRTG